MMVTPFFLFSQRCLFSPSLGGEESSLTGRVRAAHVGVCFRQEGVRFFCCLSLHFVGVRGLPRTIYFGFRNSERWHCMHNGPALF